MNLLQCIDLSKMNHKISASPQDVNQYSFQPRYRCALVTEDNPLAFSFQLTESMPVRMELFACDAIVADKLDTSFDVVVNDKVILSSFRERDCGFHKVICNIPEEAVKEGKNDVVIRLSEESVTTLFVRYVSLKVYENGREDAIMLSMTKRHASQGFGLSSQYGTVYRGDLDSWALKIQGGYMEYELDLDDVRELMLDLELCSGLHKGNIDCPIDIMLNGHMIEQGFDKKDCGFRDYSFVLPADKLNVGKNLIRIVLQAGATTCMFVKRVKIGERKGDYVHYDQ